MNFEQFDNESVTQPLISQKYRSQSNYLYLEDFDWWHLTSGLWVSVSKPLVIINVDHCDLFFMVQWFKTIQQLFFRTKCALIGWIFHQAFWWQFWKIQAFNWHSTETVAYLKCTQIPSFCLITFKDPKTFCTCKVAAVPIIKSDRVPGFNKKGKLSFTGYAKTLCNTR